MLCNRSSYTARLSTADSPQYLIPFVNSPALRTTNKGREQSIAQASLSRFARSELVRPDGPGCLNCTREKLTHFGQTRQFCFHTGNKSNEHQGPIFHGPRIWEYHYYFVKKIISQWMHLAVGSTPPHDSCRRFEAGKLDSCRLFHGCPFLPVF